MNFYICGIKLKNVMKNAFILAVTLMLTAGCTPTDFTRSEKALIENGHGMMRVLTVDNREDSMTLRQKCLDLPAAALRSGTYRLLAERLVATVTDPSQDGVGIAAPQTGINRRVAAIKRYDKPGEPFEVYPNLYIEYYSPERQCGPEGCLSIPDISGEVERSARIIIRYTDTATLTTVRDTVEGYTAVIFQHETDHLDGVLFTDSISGIYRNSIFKTTPTDSAGKVSCYRIPSITTAPDGSLIAAIDERVPSCGDLHWNRDINIVLRRSTDGGRTWGPIERAADFPEGRSASDPSMISNSASGTVLLMYNYMDHDSTVKEYRFHVMRSHDNGQSWSEPEDITRQVTPESWRPDFMFLTSGQGRVTSDGTMLHTLVNLQKGLYVISSKDQGRTWKLLPTAIRPADESKIISLSDGRWMINSRVNTGGRRHVHISADQGNTWTGSQAGSLPDPGCNGAIIRYPHMNNEKCLLFVNAADSVNRRNLTLRYSMDNGDTWSSGLTIVEGDAGYSDMTVLPSGEIVLFYERDGYTVNEVAVIPPGRLFSGGSCATTATN